MPLPLGASELIRWQTWAVVRRSGSDSVHDYQGAVDVTMPQRRGRPSPPTTHPSHTVPSIPSTYTSPAPLI